MLGLVLVVSCGSTAANPIADTEAVPVAPATASGLFGSSWPWSEADCTGSGDPPHAPFCYSGSKMGESITVGVHDFDAASGAGSMFILGEGVTPVKCKKAFSKAQQLINVDSLDMCLPSVTKSKGIKYCSDQNHVVLDASVAGMTVQLVLKPVPCTKSFVEYVAQSAPVQPPAALVAQEVSAMGNIVHQGTKTAATVWPWQSTPCSGNGDPQTKAPFCYRGTKMGETVTVRVDDFDAQRGGGTIYVLGSGVTHMKCKKTFSKAQQLISVEKIEDCLPKVTKAKGMKYCSDQDHVVLDATVGLMSVELVLQPVMCPKWKILRSNATKPVAIPITVAAKVPTTHSAAKPTAPKAKPKSLVRRAAASGRRGGRLSGAH